MTRSDRPGIRLLPAGEAAVLVEVESGEVVAALYAAVRAAAHARDPRVAATEMVPGARTLLFDGVRDPAGLRAFLAEVPLVVATAAAEGAREVVVPTRYDGPDLALVARAWDMTRAEVVATHTGTVFTVAFCGFAPGFAYCTGLPPRFHLPRHHDPRPRVPAGAVGLAGEFCGVYPRSSPGGWLLLGHTTLDLWIADRPEPATLTPGARVRFVEDPR